LGNLRPTLIRGNFQNIAYMSSLQTKHCQTIYCYNFNNTCVGIILRKKIQCGNRCSRCHTHKQTITQLHMHVQQLQQPPAGSSCLPRVLEVFCGRIQQLLQLSICSYRAACIFFLLLSILSLEDLRRHIQQLQLR
jgi:hypothetical protein